MSEENETPDSVEFDNLSEADKERARRFQEQLSESERLEAQEHTASTSSFRQWIIEKFPPSVAQQITEIVSVQGPAILHYLMHLIR